MTVTLEHRSNDPSLFGPPEMGGPYYMPPPTTYFYTWIAVTYHVRPGDKARTKRLTFAADYPSDTPGDDSASGWA